jgi:hypothetical protein
LLPAGWSVTIAFVSARFSSGWAAVCLGVGLWVNCSPDSGTTANNGSSGSGGGGNRPGSGGATGTGGFGTGGSSTGGSSTGGSSTGGSSTGGSSTGGGSTGGSGARPSDAGLPDVTFVYDAAGGSGGVTTDSACATTSVEAKLERQPADIIFAVDNSGSMSAEAGFVQTNINAFSTQIVASGVDAHVVLISLRGTPNNGQAICVDPPLGAGGCPTQDTKLPTFLHVDREVGSNDALQIIRDTYSQWSSVMRANANKHVVVITDDNARDIDANGFDTAFKGLSTSHAAYKFHGIFSFTHPDVLTCLIGGTDVCCGLSAAVGTVYRDLVQRTAGVSGNLCQQNFRPVFDQLAASVVTGSRLSCEVPMPKTDAGIVDPRNVSMEIITRPGSPPQRLGNVGSSTNCGNGGWYFDQPSAPTKLILCPNTCQAAQSAANPRINVLIACLGS